MKLLLAMIFTCLLSGCALSQNHYITVDSPAAEKRASNCGSYYMLPKNEKNNSIIKTESFHLNLCMINHHRAITGGYESAYDIEWIKVTNLSKDSSFTVDESFIKKANLRDKVLFSNQRLPNHPHKLSSWPNSTIITESGEFLWIGLPLHTTPSLQLHSDESSIVIKLKKSSFYIFYMLTV